MVLLPCLRLWLLARNRRGLSLGARSVEHQQEHQSINKRKLVGRRRVIYFLARIARLKQSEQWLSHQEVFKKAAANWALERIRKQFEKLDNEPVVPREKVEIAFRSADPGAKDSVPPPLSLTKTQLRPAPIKTLRVVDESSLPCIEGEVWP